MTVQMIKVPALAGRIVKIMGTLDGRDGVIPIMFRVDAVTSAAHRDNVGRAWWLWGERVYASDPTTPTKIKANGAQFVDPSDVLSIIR